MLDYTPAIALIYLLSRVNIPFIMDNDNIILLISEHKDILLRYLDRRINENPDDREWYERMKIHASDIET